jgi:F0F1-type ATP synthase delta subunit
LIVGKQADAEKATEAFSSMNGTAPVPPIEVDETLIGGYVIKTSSTRVDASYKGALLNLYHTITRSQGE